MLDHEGTECNQDCTTGWVKLDCICICLGGFNLQYNHIIILKKKNNIRMHDSCIELANKLSKHTWPCHINLECPQIYSRRTKTDAKIIQYKILVLQAPLYIFSSRKKKKILIFKLLSNYSIIYYNYIKVDTQYTVYNFSFL